MRPSGPKPDALPTAPHPDPVVKVQQQTGDTRLGYLYVIAKGFEPLTDSLEGCCSIQLSYATMTEGYPYENTRQCSYQLRPNLRQGFYFFLPHVS